MTLLITVLAAVVCTVIWYLRTPRSVMKLGVLCWMYWGASLMWLVDAVFAYMELGAAYFTPQPMEMLNDFYLGLSVVALGLVIWLAIVLIQDPKGIIRALLMKKN